ncbi:hypothetical protein KI688_005173 [Linnemannia hyalina]|uniref:Uncharacterized protein n=1 Tax=Linnemannia hyalina TaxID=64524 RepID=A0A9P7XNN4_9FUNG|nr:hypothetical protein KI688_005173 [Linnemannia hyalina]
MQKYALAAINNNTLRPIPFVNSTFSKTLAFYDVIEMQAPCLSPAYADIAAALKQLACSDRKLMSAKFNMHHYGTEKTMNLELRNTGGGGGNHNNCFHNRWADRCTSTGIFCGIDLFGCNTIDDGLYSCATIGQKPSLLEICPLGGCVLFLHRMVPPTAAAANASVLAQASTPVALHKCPIGECPKGATDCPIRPIDDTSLCKGAGSICGATFDSLYKYEMGSLYTCTGKGEKPTSGKPKGGERYTVHQQMLTSEETSTRGGDFDASCKFDKDTVYECSAEGATPKPGKKCGAGLCSSSDKMSTTSVATCKPDCTCKANKDTCGIDFQAHCKFPKDTLYTCVNIGDTPKQKWTLLWRGLNPDLYYNCGKGMKPFPFDRCKNGKPTTGKCLCNDGNSKCGKNFEPKCKYVPGSIYTCSGQGATPVEGKPCESAELCDSVCGAAFPESCKFKPGLLYQCDFGGADSARPTTCQIPCNP